MRRIFENSGYNYSYLVILIIIMVSLAYGAVPVYNLFCQANIMEGETLFRKAKLLRESLLKDRVKDTNNFLVRLNTDVLQPTRVVFSPLQPEVLVKSGEAALVFYKIKNLENHAISVIATYTTTPNNISIYFNKIQCFCFEEQWIAPKEIIELPVLFYIDPSYKEDFRVANVDNIILSYTLFIK